MKKSMVISNSNSSNVHKRDQREQFPQIILHSYDISVKIKLYLLWGAKIEDQQIKEF